MQEGGGGELVGKEEWARRSEPDVAVSDTGEQTSFS